MQASQGPGLGLCATEVWWRVVEERGLESVRCVQKVQASGLGALALPLAEGARLNGDSDHAEGHRFVTSTRFLA